MSDDKPSQKQDLSDLTDEPVEGAATDERPAGLNGANGSHHNALEHRDTDEPPAQEDNRAEADGQPADGAQEAASGEDDSGRGDDGQDGRVEAPDAGAPTEEKPAGQGGAGLFERALIAVVAAVLGGLIAGFFMRSPLSGDTGARLEALESRMASGSDAAPLDALEARLAESAGALDSTRTRIAGLERQMRELAETPAAVSADTVTRLETRFNRYSGENDQRANRIEGRIDRLEAVTPEDLLARLDAKAPMEAMRGLEGRVAALESDEAARDTRRAVLAVALANLTRASTLAQPFDAELEAVRLLVADHPAIAAITPFAGAGVPTRDRLVRDFDQVKNAILHADAAAEDRGWIFQLWANLRQMVTIRRQGVVDPTTTEGLVTVIEDALAAGDLAAAETAADRLQGPAKAAALDWLAGLKQRLRLEEAMAALNTDVLARLSKEVAAE